MATTTKIGTRTPMTCACGSNFTVEHVLSCPRGGFPSIRHNEIRDLAATLLMDNGSNRKSTLAQCYRKHELEN